MKDNINKLQEYYKTKYESRWIIETIVGSVFLGVCLTLLAIMFNSLRNSNPFPREMEYFTYISLSMMTILNAFRNWNKQYQGITFKENIFSLNGDRSLKGSMSSFILGISGRISQDYQYILFVEKQFGLERKEIPFEGVELIMTDKEKPNYKEMLINREERKFLIVPKNTITKRFTTEEQQDGN